MASQSCYQEVNEENCTEDEHRSETFNKLYSLCSRIVEIFRDDLSENGQRLYEACNGILDHLKNVKVLVEKIQKFVHEYDFDKLTPGNGYRSFLTVVDSVLCHTIYLAEYTQRNYLKIYFRKGHYVKEIEACNHFLASLCTCLEYLLFLREWSPSGDLFCKDHTVEELFQKGNSINQYCFYGRCLGIQYSPSIRGVLRFISICMAGFSESYYSQLNRVAQTTTSVLVGGKYYVNPEQRARRIVNISQYAEVDFCKSFWFLAEGDIMRSIPSIVGSSVKVNKVLSIPPEELHIKSVSSEAMISIPIPCSHIGSGPVSVRLISSCIRKGMIGESLKSKHIQQPATNLIIHCHGGGFVAQSSSSHELYLRDWAIALNTPILSVDYSLAPQAPFPRALEEVFYTYCWATQNFRSLGSEGEKIIFAGDSAGANLSIGCIMKCIELGVRRPDGLFMAYCPVLVDFVPSPARMLCLMDPLLPFGFMIRCLKAYACPSETVNKENEAYADTIDQIKKARDSVTLCTLDNSKPSRTNSKAAVNSVEEGFWETLSNDNEISTSPGEDASDTLASASYHNHTVENTELLTPEDASSCISFEDNSQPITKMPELSLSKTIEHVNIAEAEAFKNSKDNYVSKFLKNYMVETTAESKSGFATITTSVSKTVSEENIFEDTCQHIASNSIPSRLSKVVGGIVGAVSTKLSQYANSNKITGSPCGDADHLINSDFLVPKSPSLELVFKVPKDPYLSPYWAEDHILAQMPPTSVLTIDMDPCLDDCVMFAKKLKLLGVPVTLDILKGLPHGFLNFTMVSSQAMEGSKTCIKRLNNLLQN